MLSRLLRVQPGEGRIVGLVVSAMALSVAGMTVGESGISALFFERVGPDSLPVMYLAQGAVGVAGMLLLSAVLGRFERRRTYVALPTLLAALLVLERVGVAAEAPGIYQVLWLTTTIGLLVQGLYLWGTAGLVTDTRRAKRLFPLFGAGSILGAVVGGLGTRPLASAVGAENLLLVWALALAGTSALCAAVLGVRRGGRTRRVRSRRPSAVAELRQGFAFVRRSPLLLWMSIASILFSVLFFSLYLPFAQSATARFPDANDLAGFFGVFWATVTAAAFLISILLTNRLLGWFGAAAMLLVLPILYAGAFGILLVTSTFATLVALRFGVTAWLQGVSSTGWETLVNVVPEHRRDQTRAFLNGGPAQVGTAIAGVVQLVGQEALSPRQLSMIGLVTAVITIAVAWRVRASYTTALVDAIRSGRPRVFDDGLPNVPVVVRQDAQAVGLAIAAMGDADPRVRRLASELLESAEDARAVAALHAALHDPDPVVRARAVHAAERLSSDELDRAIADEDARVRLAAVRGRGSGEVPEPLLRDPDPTVAAAAAVRLLEGPSRPGAAHTLERLLEDDDLETRRLALGELAEAAPEDIAALGSSRLEDPSPAVRATAVHVLVGAGSEVAVPAALEGLASTDPRVRRAAREALGRLDLGGFGDELRGIVDEWSSLALLDGSIAASVGDEGDAADLLRAALLARARSRAIVALSAVSVTSPDPGAMRIALGILEGNDAGQLANAIEAIEVAAPAPPVPSLLALWEPSATHPAGLTDLTWLDVATTDDDPLIRACAELVRSSRDRGGTVTRTSGSMTQVELVLVLRQIPLFATLEPAELSQIAEIADERVYADGEVIGTEGEMGDEMHVVLEGTVRVVRGDAETIARREAGEIVGEMAVITMAPRVASLIAEGDVRTIRIGQREFEAMVRERPEIALGVMRVLAERLGAAT
ncbi:MAG TPA: Npt1/Npt2 family nucleotide transporter [Actinomycetota bacterium]|nr:Npt1/Npt2 family nucleotide transporter [Actinomycetota bacterium]